MIKLYSWNKSKTELAALLGERIARGLFYLFTQSMEVEVEGSVSGSELNIVRVLSSIYKKNGDE